MPGIGIQHGYPLNHLLYGHLEGEGEGEGERERERERERKGGKN